MVLVALLRAADRAAFALRTVPTTAIALKPPFWQEGGCIAYPLGTDAVGRDILSRLIYGARFSLLIGIVVVRSRIVVGIILGLVAGYFRGWVETLIMRLMDIVLAFPSCCWRWCWWRSSGPGLINAMLAIALVLQPHFARLTRAAVMAEKSQEYVDRGQASPAPAHAADVRTILPELHRAADRAGDARASPTPSSTPPRSASSAWARSRRRRNGAPCWPRRASSSCAPGGW